MSKLNMFAVFGILFLSSVLLGNGLYSSNQIVLAQQENEAEVNADIEQENKCKKDTECENENKIDNSLNILSNGTQQQQQQESSPCEDCFTSILSPTQIDLFIPAFADQVQQDITTIEQLCEYIDVHQGEEELNIALITAASQSLPNADPYQALILCLQDAGFDVDFPSG